MEKKIKNIFTYLSPSLLSAVLPVMVFPVLTRFLTPNDFGIIALASSFPGLIVSLLTCNVHDGGQRYYFEYRKNIVHLRSLINTTIAYLLFVLIISMPIIILLINFISNTIFGNSKYGLVVFLSYVSASLGTIVGFYLTLYRNMEEAKKFSFYTILQLLIITALNLFLVVGLHWGYMGMIYSQLWTTVFLFCILFWQFQKKFPFSFNKKMLFDNFKYGVQSLPDLSIGYIHQIFDKYLLRSMVSLSSVGIYSVAQNLAAKLFVFITAVQSTFHPIFMKDMFDRGEEGAHSIGRNFTVFTYISLSVVLMVILFGEEIVYILAPPSYYDAINVMLIILCGTAMATFGKIVGLPLVYAKKIYLSFPITIFVTICNVLLNLFFIPLWGAMGAGLVSLITIFSGLFLGNIIARKYYKIHYEKKTLFFLYLNVFASAILLIYFRIAGASFLLKFFVKTASLVAFIMVGIHAKIITKKNIKIILNIIRFKKATESAI